MRNSYSSYLANATLGWLVSHKCISKEFVVYCGVGRIDMGGRTKSEHIILVVLCALNGNIPVPIGVYADTTRSIFEYVPVVRVAVPDNFEQVKWIIFIPALN